MIYECKFPNCGYKTKNRSQIHNHHIIPKSMNGSNNKNNKIFLCPTHHSFIYIPNCSEGIHSIKYHNSIIITSILNSTNGLVLEYIEHNEIKYHFYK